ncbi:MAG: aldehyde dehydrogenase family protein, partial [Planctomycetota bacterium JB042]
MPARSATTTRARVTGPEASTFRTSTADESTGSRWRPLLVDGAPGRPDPRPAPVLGLVPGEGIGEDLTEVALEVLAALESAGGRRIDVRRPGPARGGTNGEEAAVDFENVARFCEATFAAGGAVLTGPVGGRFVYDLRRRFDLFCKLAPVRPFPELSRVGPLRPEALADVDLLLVRENIGGVYFADEAGGTGPGGDGDGHIDCSFRYAERQVRRLVEAAARLAAAREGRLTVVTKEGGLPALSALWRRCAEDAARETGVDLEVLHADHMAYRLIQDAAAFDVIAAPNLIGDVLTDLSAVLLGSRALSFSGSFSAAGPAVYQTNHGAAFDLAGRDRADPTAHVLALAMLLRESLGRADEAARVERAVREVWKWGWRSDGLLEEGCLPVGTREMGERIAEAIRRGGPGATGRDGATGAAPREFVHVSPRDASETRFRAPIAGPAEVAALTSRAREALARETASEPSARTALLERWARLLASDRDELVDMLARDVGKPVRHGRAEVDRAIALLRATARRAATESPRDVATRDRPLGVVAVVTPWNHSLAIPVGKLAPALAYGNAAVWKPAPAGYAVAVRLMRHLEAAGLPEGLVGLAPGDESTARALMSDPLVDAVTLSGSSAAGRTAQELCAGRRLPLQAELGGNNGAIVWSDHDLADAARHVAHGAFGFAGQRCTANRRVVVARARPDA